MQKYEDYFLDKVDFLHNQFKVNSAYYKELLDLTDKIKKMYSSFSESLISVIKAKFNYLGDKSSIFYKLFKKYREHLKLEAINFKDISESIQKYISENSKLDKSYDLKAEENLYKEYLDLFKIYNPLKTKIENKKKSYFKKLEEAEQLIIKYKFPKINPSNNNQEIKEEVVKNTINLAKLEESKYSKCVDDTNAIIEKINLKRKELCNYYQGFDIKRFESIYNNFLFSFCYLKACYLNIYSDIEKINRENITMDINKITNNFIEKNKSDKSTFEKIEFIPYKPISSLENIFKNINENELMNRNYEVIVSLKKHFNNICDNEYLEEEGKKIQFRNLCVALFDEKKSKFGSESKIKLMSCLGKIEYRKYFLKALTNQRIDGKFMRTEEVFNDLVDIINYILDLAEKEKNFQNARNCIILSQTFYKEVKVDKDTIRKEYLMEQIKKHKWISNISFWKESLESEINQEIKKIEEKETPKGENSIKEKNLANMFFSKLLTFSNNMNMFGVSKTDATQLIKFFIGKYNIYEDTEKVLFNNIDEIYDPVKEKEREKKLYVIRKDWEKQEGKETNKDMSDWVIEENEKKKITHDVDKKKDDDKIIVDDFEILCPTEGLENELNDNKK